MAGVPDKYTENTKKKCINEDCENDACEFDYLGMCLECNPFGDSLVMNNDPEYTSWLFRDF